MVCKKCGSPCKEGFETCLKCKTDSRVDRIVIGQCHNLTTQYLLEEVGAGDDFWEQYDKTFERFMQKMTKK